MPKTIFYSWQSDLPSKTNRGLIRDALNKAIDRIISETSIQAIVVSDREGVPGTPDIFETIKQKIDDSDVAVFDISFIAKSENGKLLPNPNVLIELGYAMKSVGMEKILLVMNTAYGPVEKLPFDINKKGVVTYEMDEAQKPATARNFLISRLEKAIRLILEQPLIEGLAQPDVDVLRVIGDHILGSNANFAQVRNMQEKFDDLEFEHEELRESIGILVSRYFLEKDNMPLIDGNTTLSMTTFGFRKYAQVFLSNYEEFLANIMILLVEEGYTDLAGLQKTLNKPDAFVELLLDVLKDTGFIRLLKGNGWIHINEITHEGRRYVRELSR